MRSSNTKPELYARKMLRNLGYVGYRLNCKKIRGKPDIAFIGKRIGIFVHGCFWHGHNCKRGTNIPASNTDYWIPKLARNKARDQLHYEFLVSQGWKILVLWECELADEALAQKKLAEFMKEALSLRSVCGTSD